MENTIKTGLLMAALTALFMVAGQAMGGQSGMTVALLLALAMNFFAYWFSDKLALKMGGAREVEQNEAPVLHALVAGLAARAGLPKPRVYLIDSDTPNAFATGRNPAHAAVAVTRGLMNILSREELEGVLAHELAHIKNRDILISSMATMTQWAMLFGMGRSSDDEEGGGGMLGAIVMMIVAPLGAALIQMAISRSREYLADATGARICGHPASLASALQRLEDSNHRHPMEVNPATAQMYIVNPLSAGTLANLFSTHPPMQERIRRLLASR